MCLARGLCHHIARSRSRRSSQFPNSSPPSEPLQHCCSRVRPALFISVIRFGLQQAGFAVGPPGLQTGHASLGWLPHYKECTVDCALG